MELRSSAPTDSSKRVAHRLPCTIHADGPAPSARAFCPFPEPIPHFRGRAMRHGELRIPEGTTMVVVENPSAQTDDGSSSAGSSALHVKYPLAAEGYFYQHDDFPDASSAVPRALQWIAMAAALHAPVDTEMLPEAEKDK